MAKWTATDIPGQTGRVAVVTGANAGIGFHTARALAARGATVVLACRDETKAAEAKRRLPGTTEVLPLDLASLASVRAAAQAFREGHERLDLLINNAGVMAIPRREETEDGFEMQFGTNHLGHFALTGLLLDLLTATEGSRVVTISSFMHRRGSIDFDDLQSERSYGRYAAYGRGKLANLLFTRELERRLRAAGAPTIAVAAHPGFTRTELQRHHRMVRLATKLLGQSAAAGARPTLYAATAPGVRGGDYYGPSGFVELRGGPKKVGMSRPAQDDAVAARLWEVSEALTGVAASLPA